MLAIRRWRSRIGSVRDHRAPIAGVRTGGSPRLRYRPASMFRSLHFQLLAIVVSTVTAVLAVSQGVDTRLTERAIKEDLQERAELALRAVDSLWSTTPASELRDRLTAIVGGDREIKAIDIFQLSDAGAALEVTTRAPDEYGEAVLAPDGIRGVGDRVVVAPTAPGEDGVSGQRVAMPLRRNGVVRGAVQVEVESADAARLVTRIWWIDSAVLLTSIVLLSTVLTMLLERRVARPVDALVDGMRRVERGELGARVAPGGGGEFRFLTEHFNTMVTRLQELTDDLGEQVRRGLADLARKNTELQAVNDRLWEAQLEIGRSERLAALGHMAGTLAHELGTPLNSVLGYVQLLRSEPLARAQHEKLAIIESQIQRMIDEIRGVLDRTRTAPARRTAVDVGALVADAVSLTTARADARQLILRTAVAAEMPPVSADALGLRQVLLNLITNAIDATPAGGTIEVGAALLPADERQRRALELRVTDSGVGMSGDELRHAFEPFYTTKGPERGTGLGLVIVEHIVRAHGGTVAAESVAGGGTTMRVRLPAERA